MRIVDLRPGPLRVWQERTARAGDGGPAGRLWERAVDRFLARRRAGREAPPAGLRVVSVGNLALGGTGKTPVTMALARDLAARGAAGAILTRGYGSRLRGPVIVTPDLAGAGDEARLMAAFLAGTGWLVVQARDRAAGLRWLAARRPEAATVLLEDGHQTAAGRHLDVLILDRWSVADGPAGPVLTPLAGPVAPWGPWRETVRGAGAADILLVEADGLPAAAADGRPVASFAREMRLEGEVPADGPWLALSGIARPEAFERDVTARLGRPAVAAVRCRDHAPYGARLVARVVAAVRAEPGATTVTTAKDWIKLRSAWPADLPVAVARQDLVWGGTKALPALVGERLANR